MKQTWAFFLWIWTFLCLPKLPLFSLMPFFPRSALPLLLGIPHWTCTSPFSKSLTTALLCLHSLPCPRLSKLPLCTSFLQSFPFFHIYIFLGELDFIWPRIPGLHFINVGKPRQELKAAAHITSSQEQRNECTCASAQLHSFSSYLLWLHIEGGSFLFYSMTFISSPEL